MKKLLLIDGNAIMHRAFHALPPLNNSKGEIVNAVYGFFSMLLTVMGDMKPTHLVVCFDRPKPTFRQAMFVGYQQHRPKMSEDLSPQFKIVHQVLEKMGAVVFELDGYEADDLIGTISRQAVELRGPVTPHSHPTSSHSLRVLDGSPSVVPPLQPEPVDIEVIILSGDRDLLQLVNGNVKVLSPVTGVKNTVLYDSAKVEEKFGIKPKQIVDYKALVGDASDGYPGVAGIGPKTASSLIQRYDSLENIYAHLGDLEEKLRTKLANDSESAELCKRLATIVTDAPITLHLEKCAVEKLDVRGLREVFSEQGFKSLGARVDVVFGKEEKIVEKKDDGQLGLLDS
jgi:DNA polymerase-1